MRRREFLKITAISAAGTVLPLHYLDAENDDPKMVLKPPSMITPNDKFYLQQIGEAPLIKAEHWRLAITGLIEKPRMVTYDELTSMESVTTMRTLKCIGDPIGTEQMSNATWTGVPLRNLLQKVGVKDDAKVVVGGIQCLKR